MVKKSHDNFIDVMQEIKGLESVDTSAETTTRTKRYAPLGIFGTLSKTLFGTLTQEDGEKLKNKIAYLFKGKNELAKLAKEDTHLARHKMAEVVTEIANLKNQLKSNTPYNV